MLLEKIELFKMWTAVICLTDKFKKQCGFKMRRLALEIVIMSCPFALFKMESGPKKKYLIEKYKSHIYRFEHLWNLYSAEDLLYKKLLKLALFENISVRDSPACLDVIFQHACKKRDFKTMNKIASFSYFRHHFITGKPTDLNGKKYGLNDASMLAFMKFSVAF